jgi:hypothetical protein
MFSDGTSGADEYKGYICYNHNSNFLRFFSNASERMRIDSSGKVGIGDTAPDALLSIKGDSNGDSNPSIRLKDGTDSRECWMSNVSGDLYLAAGGNDNAFHTRIRLMDGNAIHMETGGTNVLSLDSSQNATFAGSVSDSKGDLRKIVQNYRTAAYTLVASDSGKHIATTTGTVTIPANVFASAGGDAITIANYSGSDITIAQGSGLTLYNSADATTGNRTLAGRGMATILFFNATVAYISGAGLS